MDGNQDIVDLRPQLADILLHQERIHRNDTGPSVRRECGFADIVELRVAKEPKIDGIALGDDRLARIGKIGSAADMGNPSPWKSTERGLRTPLFPMTSMIVGE